jgi:hypothetical protein
MELCMVKWSRAAGALLALVVAAVIAGTVRNREEREALLRLSDSLGYSGDPDLFPIAYFRARAKVGMPSEAVDSALTGYARVEYYLVQIAGGPDSSIVKRYVYPLRRDALNVDVEYRRGTVYDVDVASYAMKRSRRLQASEAAGLLHQGE